MHANASTVKSLTGKMTIVLNMMEKAYFRRQFSSSPCRQISLIVKSSTGQEELSNLGSHATHLSQRHDSNVALLGGGGVLHGIYDEREQVPNVGPQAGARHLCQLSHCQQHAGYYAALPAACTSESTIFLPYTFHSHIVAHFLDWRLYIGIPSLT